MGGREVGKISRLEWEMFKRHRSRGGWSGECKEGDNRENVGLCRGRRVRVPSGVDWEFTGEARCKRAKEDRNRSGLGESLANQRGLEDRRAYVRRLEYQSPDIAVRLGLDGLNSNRTLHTCDDDVAFLFEVKNQR